MIDYNMRFQLGSLAGFSIFAGVLVGFGWGLAWVLLRCWPGFCWSFVVGWFGLGLGFW